MDCKFIPFLLAVVTNGICVDDDLFRTMFPSSFHQSEYQPAPAYSSSYVYSYSELPDWMRGMFRSEGELLDNTLLLSGGHKETNRQQTVWINSQAFTDNNQDVEKTIERFLMENNVHGVSGIEHNSGHLVPGCCQHLAFFSAVDQLTNINGVKKYLVHFESSRQYQYIPFGLCTGHGQYGNNGHCHQGTTVMNILVYKSGKMPPITFDQFEIPSYCGCMQY